MQIWMAWALAFFLCIATPAQAMSASKALANPLATGLDTHYFPINNTDPLGLDDEKFNLTARRGSDGTIDVGALQIRGVRAWTRPDGLHLEAIYDLKNFTDAPLDVKLHVRVDTSGAEIRKDAYGMDEKFLTTLTTHFQPIVINGVLPSYNDRLHVIVPWKNYVHNMGALDATFSADFYSHAVAAVAPTVWNWWKETKAIESFDPGLKAGDASLEFSRVIGKDDPLFHSFELYR